MPTKRMDSILWLCAAALCAVPACAGSNASTSPAAQANTAALSNEMDDDTDGMVDESDEGMDEDEDGTVDEAHEHHDMCMKRHHARKGARGSDGDDNTDEAAEHAVDGGMRTGRGPRSASDDDSAADEAAEHAADGGMKPERSAKRAAAGGAAADGSATGKQGRRHPSIDSISCSDVPASSDGTATTPDAG